MSEEGCSGAFENHAHVNSVGGHATATPTVADKTIAATVPANPLPTPKTLWMGGGGQMIWVGAAVVYTGLVPEGGAVDVTRSTGDLGGTPIQELVNVSGVWLRVTASSLRASPYSFMEGVTGGFAKDLMGQTGDLGGAALQKDGAANGVLIQATASRLWASFYLVTEGVTRLAM